MTARLQVTGVRLVFCIAACALSFPVCAHYHFLSTETDAYRVELINWERHGEGYSEVRFVLLITDRTTGKEQRVEIDNRLTGIERLDIAQGMLLAYGDVGGHFEGLTLVRLANAEVTDFILSYGSDLSPARRYLVFRKFYPPRGMTATRSDVVLVYDLAQERSENWLPGAPGVPAGKNVGLPVYPHENVDPVTYRVWVAEECQRHYVDPQAGFLWTRDEKSLFFIDKTPELLTYPPQMPGSRGSVLRGCGPKPVRFFSSPVVGVSRHWSPIQPGTPSADPNLSAFPAARPEAAG